MKLSKNEVDNIVLEATMKISKSEEVGAKSCSIKCPFLGLSKTRLENELKKIHYTILTPTGSDCIIVLND